MRIKLLAMLAACSAMSACGAGGMGSDASSDGPANRDGGDGGAMDSGADSPSTDGGPMDSGHGPPAGCSGDLRSVLASDGTVLTTCPNDQGCAGAMCVPACSAAAMSHGNVGCDFLIPTPPAYPPALPPCFAAFVANNWPQAARIAVTNGATSLDVTQFGRIPVDGMPVSAWTPVPSTGIPPYQVAVLFLSSDPNSIMPETGEPLTCPITPAVNMATIVNGTGLGTAFHVSSDTPVSLYDIMPYGGAHSHFPSAELLLPSSAWGTSYVVNDAPPGTASPPGPMFAQVVALSDATTVRIRPTVNLPGNGGVPAAPMGTVTSVMLAAGQYVQWELPAGSFDPSGSLVASDQPVAVFAGNRFFRLQPVSEPGGESTHQQMAPAPALGTEYVAAPYATRRMDLMPETIPYRIVGAFDGTMLTFDPPIAGAPATLSQGQVVDLQSAMPFRVSSQDAMHPFSFAQVMPTGNTPSGSRPGATDTHYALVLGDEEHVIVVPPAQFLTHYVFFTDPSYPTTNIVITRMAVHGAFSDVSVDCLPTVTGWQPVGTDGRFEVTNVDLVRAGVGNGSCINGRHVADSEAPFGIVVWGEDSYSSYAYPAGGNASTLASLQSVIPG